ncbi:hypothetical protein [Anaerotignum lactatifermentans]|uniref:hypothetical protein n=1 Tax=Anaerotignum lactatifermentans TaxID=160404 RepID=UPI002673CB4B|nr:hypothetical protein [Anaerotignum lactatifermentans]
MSLQFIFREISSADTDILHMIELRKANVEDYLCCEVTNEDGITNTTWYSKEDVALWGEDYIRANTTMEYSDFTGWIISLDLEPWNDMQEASKKKKQAPCFQAPSWLEGHIKEWKQKRLTTVTLCSTSGNERLEVWYYGDLLTINGEPQLYIVPSYFAPELVTARDPESGEEFVVFDGGRHGYDNMFCDEHDLDELERRTLKRYEILASKLILELGYSIDYEDEKEDFQVNEDGMVALINGERMPWEQVKRDGIDYIALYYVNEEGKQVQILDNELA